MPSIIYILPELFLSLGIMSLLMFGLFIKKNFKLLNLLTVLTLIFTIILVLIVSFSQNIKAKDNNIEEGARLAHFSGCFGCHTTKEDFEFSGGRPLKTKYGIFFTPNITSHKKFGIGRWSEKDWISASMDGGIFEVRGQSPRIRSIPDEGI